MHSYTKNKKNFSGEVNWVHQALTSYIKRYDVNASKQITLLDGVDIGTPKWRPLVAS